MANVNLPVVGTGATGPVPVRTVTKGGIETQMVGIDLGGAGAEALLTGKMPIDPGTGATDLGKAEDSVHVSGDTGVAVWAVRKDAASAYGADGDYSPLSTDANGALRVTGASGATEYTEDAAAAANPAGPQLIARRRDTLTAAEVSADGDVIALNATSKGQIHTYSESTILSAPAAARTTDSIGVAQQTDAIMTGLTALTPKFAKIDRATLADGAAVVSLVSAKKIRVLRLTLVAAGAVGAKWQSSTSNSTGAGSNTDLCPVMSLSTNGGISDAFCPVGLFETVAGEALKLNLNAAVQVSGYLTYIEV